MTEKQVYSVIIFIFMFVLLAVLYLTESNFNRVKIMQTNVSTISQKIELITKDIEEIKLKIAILQQQTVDKKELTNKYNTILNRLKTNYVIDEIVN